MTEQAREASWKKVRLRLCHRNKSRLKGLNKEPGLRKCQDPNGKHSQRTRKPGGIERQEVQSAACRPFPGSVGPQVSHGACSMEYAQ